LLVAAGCPWFGRGAPLASFPATKKKKEKNTHTGVTESRDEEEEGKRSLKQQNETTSRQK
jgi:hypothetical protein